MKIIFKKIPWFTLITTLCLVIVTLFAVNACKILETLPKFTLNFVGEGVDIEPQSIIYGNYAIAPQNPERDGYDFSGWFTDNGTFANEWDFKTDIVTQDTTLYVKWAVEEEEEDDEDDDPLQDYPREISFTEYSLPTDRIDSEPCCRWENLNYDNTIVLINSNEELANHIHCIEVNYSEIDFSKYTLVVANGLVGNGAGVVSKQLLQLSKNKYKLDIEIHRDITEKITKWVTPLIVNKLSKKSDIELIVVVNNINI